MKWLLLIFSCLQVTAADWLLHDPARRVPFLSGGGFARDEYHWWVLNTGQPSKLFQNGVFVSQEVGDSDIRLVDAWEKYGYGGVPVSVIDALTTHSLRIADIAELTSGAEVSIHNIPRLYPEFISAAISNRVAAGFKVMVISAGHGPDERVYNACRYAEAMRAFVVCAVPNVGISIDEVPDYPSSWARFVSSIVPVTSTDRTGELYGPNAAAWGEYVTGAPGRNIVAAGTYSSGTSYAAPIVAGCLSMLMLRNPELPCVVYRNALWSSCDSALMVRRVNAMRLMRSL